MSTSVSGETVEVALLVEAVQQGQAFTSVMSNLNALRERLLGTGQLTVNARLRSGEPRSFPIVLQRLWSSHPADDAVGGRKTKEDTAWTRQVFWDARMFVGEGDAAISGAFDDHERIKARGLHAIVNVPIVEDGVCLATLNVLTTREGWTETEVALIKLMAAIVERSILDESAELMAAL